MRLNIGKKKLSSLLLAACHTDKLNVFDKKQVAEEFIAMSTHRKEKYDTFLWIFVTGLYLLLYIITIVHRYVYEQNFMHFLYNFII